MPAGWSDGGCGPGLGGEGRGSRRCGRGTADHLQLMEEQHAPELEEGGVRLEEGGEVGDAVVVLVEALDDVGDKIRVGDRGANLRESVRRRLLKEEVVGDGAILLADGAERLGEVDLAGLLVVVEEPGDGSPHREGSGVRGHDKVHDVHRHGTVQPAEHCGVEAEPGWVGWRLFGGEVILKRVGGDGHEEEGAPLGKRRDLEVEDDGDEGADVLDGGGLRPEVGVGVGLGWWRSHGRGGGWRRRPARRRLAAAADRRV